MFKVAKEPNYLGFNNTAGKSVPCKTPYRPTPSSICFKSLPFYNTYSSPGVLHVKVLQKNKPPPQHTLYIGRCVVGRINTISMRWFTRPQCCPQYKYNSAFLSPDGYFWRLKRTGVQVAAVARPCKAVSSRTYYARVDTKSELFGNIEPSLCTVCGLSIV